MKPLRAMSSALAIPRKRPIGASGPACWGSPLPMGKPPDLWPSQSEVADALYDHTGPSRAGPGGGSSPLGKGSSVTSVRHELCEQIQRLGGVVTIGELIELTILLRPAADTLDTARQQRMASAIARAAVETESSMAEPRFQTSASGRQGRRLVLARVGGLCREVGTGCRQLGGERSAPAVATSVPGTLRSAAARFAARMSAIQQRADAQAWRRR